MKNIIIVPQAITGIRPNPYGYNGEGQLFKKTLAQKLCDNLNRDFKKENINYKACVDTQCDEDINELAGQYELILISPHIIDRVNISQTNKDSYYILNSNEFDEGNTNKIISFLR
jgi:hypothetical protein